ncbi:MAG: hypothetical protein K1W06_01785 [Lachnospiraceae bacterium]
MKSYDKVIFICTTNTFCSPIAEAVYKEIAPAWLPEAVSRGIVVLFPEPISPKVNVILSSHDMEVSNHKHSMQMEKDDITPDTLLLVMAFSEKVKLMEDFGIDNNVYTIGEFIGEDTDMINPYGADDAQYQSFFEEVQKRVERVILRIEAIYHEEGGEDNDSIGQ